LRLGPFSEHILDAIRVNLKRLFLYARLSYGLSIPSSLGLIFFEVIILPLAWYYDVFDRRWGEFGLSLLEKDFIDMKEIPNFKDKATDIPNGKFPLTPVWKIRAEVSQKLSSKQWHQAFDYLTEKRSELDRLGVNKKQPLVVHFLESIHRATGLTIKSLKDIPSKEIERSFLQYRSWFIYWQMVGLESALLLDFIAWPLRKKGLLIFEQDVPKIPIPKI
jgi:hypothetical protein